MHAAGVKRLLVTDHRRHLLGIIAAADLLKNFARSDEDIRAAVRARLKPLAARISVPVHDGEVTLTGQVRDATTAAVARDLARAEPGVAAVVSDLRIEHDAARPVTVTPIAAQVSVVADLDRQPTRTIGREPGLSWSLTGPCVGVVRVRGAVATEADVGACSRRAHLAVGESGSVRPYGPE